MEKTRSGQDVANLFQRLGSSEPKNGDDLDWLWETDAKDFLAWACDNLGQENVLTDQELKQWKKLQKESPELILSGKRLEDALKLVDRESVVKEELPIVCSNVEEVREELDIRETTLNELKRLKSMLSARKGRLALSLADLEKRCQVAYNNLGDEQRRMLRVNADFNMCLDKLELQLEKILKILSEKSRNVKDPMFISEADLSTVLKEDDYVHEKIRAFIQSRFSKSGLENNVIAQHIHGRGMEEFEKLVNEIDRLRYSYEDVERERILCEAELVGAKAGQEELERQVKNYHQKNMPLDPAPLQATVTELESSVMELSREISAITKDTLPQLVEKKAATYCTKILKADLQAKIERQRYTATQLDLLVDFLIEQTACQELLGGLFQQEINSLDRLDDVFKQVLHAQKSLCETSMADQQEFQNCKEREERSGRNTLQPWDKVLTGLHRILSDKDVDPSMITYEDVNRKVSQFVEDNAKSDQKFHQATVNWHQERDRVTYAISKLHSELQMDAVSGCALTSAEVSVKLKHAQADVRDAEAAVRDVVTEWDQARRTVKDNPMLAVEKSIWKDFVNQPQVMEQTVYTMKSKAAKKTVA